MTDLGTSYMGLPLTSPVIAGSSTQTFTVEKVKALEAAGAGAVVLKSLFEEQIRAEVSGMYEALEGNAYPEAYDYVRADLPMQLGPAQYLERLERIKKAAGIPVIGSINCTTADRWVGFARQVQAAGADGIELNVYDIPSEPDVTGRQIEERHVDLVRSIMGELGIPVAVKIGSFYSSLLEVCGRLSELGVGALVLFNRFFQPDIDVEKVALKSSVNFSSPADILLPLRWVAILRDQVRCDLALTGGVHEAEGAVKAILAGADAVQVCSVLYQRGPGQVTRILEGIGDWMDRHGYATLSECRGLLREQELDDKRGFERAQYVKTLIGIDA